MTDVEQLIIQCNLNYPLFADVCNDQTLLSYAIFTISDIRPDDFTDGKSEADITSFNLSISEKGHKNLKTISETIYSKLVSKDIAVSSYFIEYDSKNDYTSIYYSCSI